MDNIYVLYGINKFLLNYNLKKIIGDNECDNYNSEEILIQDILNYARELPMFNDKNFIVCDNSLFLTSSKSKLEHDIDSLIEYINKPSKHTVLVFCVNSEKLDSRKKINTLLAKNSIECNNISDEEIFKYTKDLFKNNNVDVKDDVIRHLLFRLNNNIELVASEVDKLSLLDTEITIDLIDDTVHQNIDDNIFNFIDSIINNDKKKMFMIYENSIDSGLEPIQIITMLANEFRAIYQVRVLSEMGYLDKDIMSMLDIYKIGRIKFLRSKGRMINNSRLLKEISNLADLDIKIKTGEIDKYNAFEKYLIEL